MTMRSQKEITLKNDLAARDRLDIYRNFLLYCMSGDVVALPMGSTGWALVDSALFALFAGLCCFCGVLQPGHWPSGFVAKYRVPDVVFLGPQPLSSKDTIGLYHVRHVVVPGSLGSLTFLPNHALNICIQKHITEHCMPYVQWWWNGTAASLRGCRSWETFLGSTPWRLTLCTPAWLSRHTAAKYSRYALPLSKALLHGKRIHLCGRKLRGASKAHRDTPTGLECVILRPHSCRTRGMQALGSGIMNKEKAEQLAEMRDKMGLSKEAAEKIIKGVQNQHLIGNLQVCLSQIRPIQKRSRHWFWKSCRLSMRSVKSYERIP